jgi:AcrR family transcriptional regulator
MTPSPPDPISGSVRDRILDQVFQLIAREGIAAVSNRRVAAAASVSLGSVTYHFPSQRDLLREGLRRHIRIELARIEGLAKKLRDRTLAPAELGDEIQRLTSSSAQRPEFRAEVELHLHAARDPELQEVSRECFAAYRAFAEAAMEALGVPEPERHSSHVVNLMMGTALQQLGTGEADGAGLGEALQTIAQGAIARAATAAAPAWNG